MHASLSCPVVLRRFARRTALRWISASAAALALFAFPAMASAACTTSAIRASNGAYVSTELFYGGDDAGMLRARASAVGPWEKYSICTYIDGNYAYSTIQSLANGLYVSAEIYYGGNRYGMLRARSSAVGPWEKFNLNAIILGPFWGGMASWANWGYVTADFGNQAMLRARASSVGSWEQFKLVPVAR